MTSSILIAAGGTGGHVFPALAVATGLMARGHELSWIGSNRGLEARVVSAAGIRLSELSFQGLRGRGPLAWVRLPFGLVFAVLACWSWMRQESPRLVVVFGGYVSFPVAIAARLMGRPVMVHEQNAVMGTANRWISKWAKAVVVSFEKTRFAPPESQWIGNPVRSELLSLTACPERLAPRDGPLRVLVLGGSLGARPLNQSMPAALLSLSAAGVDYEVRHQTGASGFEEGQRHYRGCGVVADITAFIEDMRSAYAWADVAVCRAGASTVAEMTAVGLPAIYVPLPHAIDDHQTANAAAVVAAGGAWMVTQSDNLAAELSNVLLGLDRNRLAGAADALRRIRPVDVEQRFLALCESLIQADKTA